MHISVGLKELKLIVSRFVEVGHLLFFCDCGSFFDIFYMHFGDIRSLLCSKWFSHSNFVWVFFRGCRGYQGNFGRFVFRMTDSSVLWTFFVFFPFSSRFYFFMDLQECIPFYSHWFWSVSFHHCTKNILTTRRGFPTFCSVRLFCMNGRFHCWDEHLAVVFLAFFKF